MADIKIPEGMTEKEYYEIHASQEEFLDWYYRQELPQYEKPSVTVDMVAYCFVEGKIKLLLIRRKAHPYQNCLALVGGFMDKGEDAAHACQREVREEVNLDLPLEKIEQLMTVSTPGRDPRGWTVTIAHLVYLPSRALDLVQAGDDAKDVVFVDVDFRTGKCFLEGVELDEQAFPLTIMPLSKSPSNASKAVSTGIRPSFIYWKRSSLSTRELNWSISSTPVAQLSAITFSSNTANM